MNTIAHIFFGYLSCVLFLGKQISNEHMLAIILFSVLIDIDHISGLIKYLKISKNKRKLLPANLLAQWFRSGLQEPIGIIFIVITLGTLWILGVHNIIIPIGIVCILTHWFVDFLTVQNKPFAPFSDAVFSLKFKTKKQRLQSEIYITLIVFILFLLVYYNCI